MTTAIVSVVVIISVTMIFLLPELLKHRENMARIRAEKENRTPGTSTWITDRRNPEAPEDAE